MLITALVDTLHRFYGPLPTPPKGLFQFFVWEVLSRDVLPARRDMAWQALHRIPALTPDALWRAAPKVLADAVGLIGGSRDERVEVLRGGASELRRHRELEAHAEHAVSLLDAARALKQAPLDRFSRHRALLFVSGFPLVPVDRGVARVAARLGLAASDRVRDVRRVLGQLLPPDIEARRRAAVYLMHHATHACVAVAPYCPVCPLRDECPRGQVAGALGW